MMSGMGGGQGMPSFGQSGESRDDSFEDDGTGDDENP